MKKSILFVLSVFTVLFFFACKKSDSSSSSIVGRWKATKDRYKMAYVGANNQTITEDTTMLFGVPHYFNFDQNGSFQFTCDTCTSPETGTYNVVNNSLILGFTGSTDKDTLDIQTLNSSELVLHLLDYTSPDDYFEFWRYFNRQ